MLVEPKRSFGSYAIVLSEWSQPEALARLGWPCRKTIVMLFPILEKQLQGKLYLARWLEQAADHAELAGNQ